MDKLHIPATSDTPEIDFDFGGRRLLIKGESYPESAANFYGPILENTDRFLGGLTADDRVEVHVELRYFNSSSTKMLFTFFDRLNASAESGVRVDLHWYHDIEDDMILEFGEELAEDFPQMGYHPHAVGSL
ncbi:MAG: DUF1987 domain-containing protein [Halothiobacillaceae bacterium]